MSDRNPVSIEDAAATLEAIAGRLSEFRARLLERADGAYLAERFDAQLREALRGVGGWCPLHRAVCVHGPHGEHLSLQGYALRDEAQWAAVTDRLEEILAV
jgi:hypothetical protein